jgi:hypothetical protein
MSRTATCVWRTDAALVTALDEHLGPPVDSYLNGSQVWLAEVGPGGCALEFRLHPVAGYRLAAGMSHYDVWEQVVAALAAGAPPEALPLGDETRALTSLWDGLECFAAYGDDLEPAPLASTAAAAVGIAPDATGLVDHARIGSEWERTKGGVSIVDLLVAELRS